MSKTNTFKTTLIILDTLEKGYTFKENNRKRLITVKDILKADNAHKPIYVFKPNGFLGYIQNERK